MVCRCRIILGRHLSQLQCIALALLVIGATMSQARAVRLLPNTFRARPARQAHLHAPWLLRSRPQPTMVFYLRL